MYEAKKYGIDIRMNEEVLSITQTNNKHQTLNIQTTKGSLSADAVIISSGGHNSAKNYNFIQ